MLYLVLDRSSFFLELFFSRSMFSLPALLLFIALTFLLRAIGFPLLCNFGCLCTRTIQYRYPFIITSTPATPLTFSPEINFGVNNVMCKHWSGWRLIMQSCSLLPYEIDLSWDHPLMLSYPVSSATFSLFYCALVTFTHRFDCSDTFPLSPCYTRTHAEPCRSKI